MAKNSKRFIELNHPILRHYLGMLRDKNTNSHDFRRIMNEMSRLLAYEVSRDLPTKKIRLETPLAPTDADVIADPPVIVSIMRAGNGMIDGLLSMFPQASAGHIGIYRDRFIKNTVEYYFRLPDNVENKMIILADPLLATGDTAIASIDRLKQYKVGPIRMVCILASATGLERLHHFHPDVEIYAIAKEGHLNERGFLIPGIGDVGSRLYQLNT